MSKTQWTHVTVYQALVGRGERVKPSRVERYVVLYPQEEICAVLYAPTTERYGTAPLHLNRNRRGWRPDIYQRIKPAIEAARVDNKGPGKERQNYTHYRVLDWNLLAAVLGLEATTGIWDDQLPDDLRLILGDQSTSSTEKESLVSARIGQGEFRRRVLAFWNKRCSVTESTIVEAIRASHIKPWRESTNAERLDPSNGLPLIANYDALFDAGLISFDSGGHLIVSSRLPPAEQQVFGLCERALTKAPSTETARYLAYHCEHVFRK